MSLPLVSCIMPTYGRPDYVAESISMFLAQDYPAKELIVLNDCPGQILKGDFPGVRIVNVDIRWPNLGDKRNAAIEMAQGEYLAVWDDDDVYLPWRLSHCMRRMREIEIPFYCPAEFWAYWGEDKLHDNQAVAGWICHPAVMFTKQLWTAVGGYPQQTMGEDAVFLTKAIEHMGIEWPRDKILRDDRFLIMRGKSKYAHTSISGGQQGPDTRPGEVFVPPKPIDDPILRSSAERLTRIHEFMRSRKAACQERTLRWPGLPTGIERYWLDQWQPTSYEVGYGQLGQGGELGYEGKRVEVCGMSFPHALSAHAPSSLCYELNGQFTHFCSQVALNDDVCTEVSSADFMVYVDGNLKGIATNVRTGQLPRMITVDIRGAESLELVIQHRRWDCCHAVWCDPFLAALSQAQLSEPIADPVGRVKVSRLALPFEVELCIATVGSAGYEEWIDDLFGSICTNGRCPHAMLAIFSLDNSAEIQTVADKYGASVISCQPAKPLNCASKSVVYSAGRIISAKKLICLDADMLVLGDLRPVADAIDAIPQGSLLVCREAKWARTLGDATQPLYYDDSSIIDKLLASETSQEREYSLIVNDGIIAGTAVAFSAIDDAIRGFQQAHEWIDDHRVYCPWRNQFLFNLALAQTASGVELDSRFNAQLNAQSAVFQEIEGQLTANVAGRKASIVHFNGCGRGHHSEWRGRFRGTSAPIIHSDRSAESHYLQFLHGLRNWLGYSGRQSLAWSYYGTHAGDSSRECKAADFPLFAAVYYLLRSNGCQRVIETGTARGVSTACLASAVANYPNAYVVTLDCQIFPEREELWRRLDRSVQACIQPRQCDSVTGLKEALERGEQYEAAVLDSLHTAEHVLAEFDIARKLVCQGGLILIHDAVLAFGTVSQALNEITKMGYGVTRLWTAESGDQADAGFGMAVIENRTHLPPPNVQVDKDLR